MVKKSIQKFYSRTVDALRRDRLYYIFALLAVAVSALFAAIMITRTLPFAEGWYTYYSECINNGELPYVDFEYLYSPVYIYFTALITRIFGYKLMVLRSLGVIFFALIALGVYMSVSVIVGKKRSWIALIASLTAVFYLQSEVVQVFYDYVRLMDACAAFALYFLLKSVKSIINKEPCTKSLVALGLLLAFFTNIKQNTGLIFSVYALILIIYISVWAGSKFKEIAKNLVTVLIPIASVTLIIYSALFFSGSLSSYISMTGLSAASAKGGMQAILFGWISNNRAAFTSSIPIAIFSMILIVGLYFLRKSFKKDVSEDDGTKKKNLDYLLGLAFSVLAIAGLLVLKFSKSFAELLAANSYWSPYAIFLTVFPIFVACGIWGIVDIVRKKNTMSDSVLLFVLAGAYFAIAFACGNSGGLAEGQSAFGVAFIITCVLLFLDYMHLRIIRVAAVLLCLILVLQFADKKMLSTYNWWGMNESDYWACTEELDIELLDGIKVSPETKYVYESIHKLITENTNPDDPIFCFPQIPLFYSLCDRSDPGTFTKVQWFDVATDKSVLADIEVLKNNPPKAIIIYNTADGAYSAHEGSFRGGNESGTRALREFLYNYASDNGYRFCGRFVANNNSISVWIADSTGETPSVNFESGSGTASDPYVIATPEQLQYFASMVKAGRTFDGQYIRQARDIDMAGYEFTPIGSSEDGTYFAGTFDGGGYTVHNIILSDEYLEKVSEDTSDSQPSGEEQEEGEKIYFFGTTNGTAINMTFENCPFTDALPQK